MFWLKIFLALSFVTTLSFSVYASEGGEPEGGAEKKTTVDDPYSGAQTNEWTKIQKELQTAKVKYDNDQKILDDLKAAAGQNENLSKESLETINKATQTVKQSEENYNRFLNQYKMRFPEKGLDVGRKYERSDSEHKNLDTVEEKPQGVEANLRKLNKDIKQQYAPQASDKKAAEKKKKKAAKKQSSDESNPQASPTDVTGKIIIEK